MSEVFRILRSLDEAYGHVLKPEDETLVEQYVQGLTSELEKEKKNECDLLRRP